MHKGMPYSLRKSPTLGLPKTHSFYYSKNAAHSRASVIWNNLPDVVKSSDSLFEFENKIKYIGNIDCGCLTLSGRRSLSYRNQSIDLHPKSMDWFLYDNGLHVKRVNIKGYMMYDVLFYFVISWNLFYILCTNGE